MPVHYDLSVFDLNTVDFTFHGLVKIHLRVQKSTNKIALNAKELKIKPEDGLVTVGEGKIATFCLETIACINTRLRDRHS